MSNPTDRKLIETAGMLTAQLSEIHQELVKRGIEVDAYSYSTGRIEFKYERVTRELLKGVS